MNTSNTLFTELLLESIAEENNIDERVFKNIMKKAVPIAGALALATGGIKSGAVKNPFSSTKTTSISQPAKSISIDYVSDQKELLKRQGYAESGFDTEAVSSAGAAGIAQSMRSNIEDYLKKNPGEEIDPYNPEHSIKLQVHDMNDLYNASFIDKKNQAEVVRLAKTLAAYNWGRGNLSDHLNKKKNEGVDIYNSFNWMKGMPKETINYINKILLKKDATFERDYKKAKNSDEFKEIINIYNDKNFKNNK